MPNSWKTACQSLPMTVLVLLAVLCTPCAAGQASASKQALSDAVELVKNACATKTDEQGRKDYVAFQKLLPKIQEKTGEAAPEAGKADFEDVLVSLGQDRRQQKETSEGVPAADDSSSLPLIGHSLHDELARRYRRERYGGPDIPRAVYKQPPPLLPQHCTEEYRCTWESIVLAPECKGKELAGNYAFVALATLKDSKSLAVLTNAYWYSGSADSNKANPGQAFERRRKVLAALGSYRSKAAFEAMVGCMALDVAEPQLDSGRPDKSLEDWAVLYLASEDNALRLAQEDKADGKKHVSEWRKVVMEYEGAKAPNERARAFVKTVKAKLGKADEPSPPKPSSDAERGR